jgi:peptidyl-prolyl cis-trans isomerase C
MKLSMTSPLSFKHVLTAAAVVALTTATSTLVFAAEEAPVTFVQGPKVMVTSADIQADALMRMPEEMRALVLANAKTVGQIASNLYVRRAWGEQAVAGGLDKDPLVAAALQVARDKVLSDAWIEQLDRKNTLDEAALLKMARDSYTAKPERFKVGEQVQARHILIAGVTPEARAQAEQVLKDLKAGGDFAKLAEAHSADKGNAAKGGDLGFFGKGRMVPPFEEAVFALKNKGDLSGVVETQFGYHLIQLEGRKPAGVRPFDEVKDELVKQIANDLKQNARVEAAQVLQAVATTKTEAIDAFAKRHAPAAEQAAKKVAPPAPKP